MPQDKDKPKGKKQRELTPEEIRRLYKKDEKSRVRLGIVTTHR